MKFPTTPFRHCSVSSVRKLAKAIAQKNEEQKNTQVSRRATKATKNPTHHNHLDGSARVGCVDANLVQREWQGRPQDNAAQALVASADA